MRVARAATLRWNSGTDFKLVLCQNFGEYYNDPQHPPHAGQEMPTADASALRKPKR
jgi:hypothetical protein